MRRDIGRLGCKALPPRQANRRPRMGDSLGEDGLTDRAADILRRRIKLNDLDLIFSSREEKPYLVTSLNHLHQKIRESMRLPADFVIHSLRHTMLTRLGESGVDAFAIMRIAGHSSITVSQRYVHPSPEAVERAFERLQALRGDTLGEEPKRLPSATIVATS